MASRAKETSSRCIWKPPPYRTFEGLGLVGSGDVVLYEALSYTWDSPVLSHAIRYNGLDFSVTANLHAALVHLRSSHGPRWL